MKVRFIIIIFAIVLLILFGLGASLTENCVGIGGCKSCWKTTQVVVTSDLCGANRTCLAQPADQQNNAIVDAVLCACDKAKTLGYSDTVLNTKIQDTVSEFSRYNISINDICDQPGMFLTKRLYT